MGSTSSIATRPRRFNLARRPAAARRAGQAGPRFWKARDRERASPRTKPACARTAPHRARSQPWSRGLMRANALARSPGQAGPEAPARQQPSQRAG